MGVRRAKQPRISQDLSKNRSRTNFDCKVCGPNRRWEMGGSGGPALMEFTGFGSPKIP